MNKRLIYLMVVLMTFAYQATAQENVYNSDSSHVHNSEALACIQQLLDNKIDSARFAQSRQYIMKWASVSHDIDVNIDENIGEFMETAAGQYYIMGYIAACAEAELIDGTPSMNWPRFIKAMTRLVDFYKLNRDITGTVERLERYASLPDSQTLAKTLREDFAELIKDE